MFIRAPTTCFILSQIDPVHALPTNFLNMKFNIIIPAMPWSSKLSLTLRLPHQNPVCTAPTPTHATSPTHYILIDLISQIMFGEV
jgi:hypothetical protein